MAIPKMWLSPIFEKKHFFQLKMPEICPEKPVFCIFSKFPHLFFLICTKMGISNAKTCWVLLLRKIFSSLKCRKSPFLQVFIGFFPYITLFFCIIVDSNSQYSVKVAGTANCRARKRIFFNFSCFTQYFIHESLLYSFARSFICFLCCSFVHSCIRLFDFQYLFH